MRVFALKKESKLQVEILLEVFEEGFVFEVGRKMDGIPHRGVNRDLFLLYLTEDFAFNTRDQKEFRALNLILFDEFSQTGDVSVYAGLNYILAILGLLLPGIFDKSRLRSTLNGDLVTLF